MDRHAWLQWRQKGIGSSDAPIIMNVSKFSTPLKLYQSKLAEIYEEDESNSFIKDKGNKIESKVRSYYEIQQGEAYSPALREQHIEGVARPILASFDGLNDNNEISIEIKLMGADMWNAFKGGIVPAEYFPQVQHQFLADPRVKKCVMIGYLYKQGEKEFNSANVAEKEIYPDKEYMSQLLQEEIKFIDALENKRPPLPTEKDYDKFKNPRAKILLRKFKSLKGKLEKLEESFELVKKELIEIAESEKHNRLAGYGVKMRQQARQGNVNYKKIISDFKPELLDHENDYRGKGSTSWVIQLDEVE